MLNLFAAVAQNASREAFVHLCVFRRLVAPLFGHGHQSPLVETLLRTYESRLSMHAASATQDHDEDCDCGRSECRRSVTHSRIVHYSSAQPKKMELRAKSSAKTAEREAYGEKGRKRRVESSPTGK